MTREARGAPQGRAAGRRQAETMCDNCPFARTGPGAQLRRSLRPGRMAEIKRALLMGGSFPCHKTTDDDGWDDYGEFYAPTGRERECGGGVRFLNARRARP